MDEATEQQTQLSANNPFKSQEAAHSNGENGNDKFLQVTETNFSQAVSHHYIQNVQMLPCSKRLQFFSLKNAGIQLF